jgi:4-amino-4-deoxy-L-arabinose transferase-like glycosyltransferase
MWAALLALAVIVPRFALFGLLGGRLPMPPRDQELYVRLAGRLSAGQGLSFSPDEAAAKHGMAPSDAVGQSWSGTRGLVFGIAPAGEPTATVEPGYPVLLTLAFAVTGPATGSVFLLNTLFFLAGAFAVRELVRRSWGRPAADIAGFLWALYPPFVYYTAYAMTEAAHVSLLAVTLLLVDRSEDGAGWAAAAGAALGVLFLIRATALLVMPFLLGWLLWRLWRSGGARRAMPRAGLMLAAFCLALAPWVVRNALEMGSPVVMPTKGSLNLWMRNNPEALAVEGIGLPRWVEESVGSRELLEYPDLPAGAGELRRSDALGGRAMEFALANPLLLAWLAPVRLGAFMDLSPGGGAVGLAQLLLFGGVTAAGCVGLYLHRRAPTGQLLALIWVAYALVHSLAHGGVRYRMPVETVMIIGTALLARRLLQATREGERG